MRDIRTYSPASLSEALDILSREGEGVKAISGGTDVIVQVLEGKREPIALLDLRRLRELRYICEDNGSVRIGPLATHREIERSQIITNCAAVLSEAAFIVGSPQIKNLGTIGGNIANASPVADSVPALMVLDAVLTLSSRSGERRIPVREFAVGPGKSVLRPDELITDISFVKPGADEISFYERLGQRRLLAISKVGVAFKARVQDGVMSKVAIALGAVAPTVIVATRAAAYLEGKAYSEKTAEEAGCIAEGESRAITDVRSTADYRNKMVGALLMRGLARIMSRRSE
ncbi:MAG: xanthine dehydrogenase family protein subunit M [bacterium]